MSSLIDELWMYRVNDDGTVKYLFIVFDVSEKSIMAALKPFLDKRKSYLYHPKERMVAEHPDKVFRFGIVYAIKGIEEPGYCYRCSSKGVMHKTALICPRCRSCIGGF